MLKIKEAIVVEGKYDKNTLSQIVDTMIIVINGFSIFKNSEMQHLIKDVAESRGIIILTDSDSAGFVLRNHIKSFTKSENIKQAYIPEIFGRERRKKNNSKEGKLGVEGMSREVLVQSLRNAGVTVLDADANYQQNRITKTDLFRSGYYGRENSAEKRGALLKALGLPQYLSAGALTEYLNCTMSREDYWRYISEFKNGMN